MRGYEDVINFNRVIGGAVCMIITMVLMTSPASANIIVSDPVVGTLANSNLEIGAEWDVTISYRNDTGSPVNLLTAAFHVIYNNTILDGAGADAPRILPGNDFLSSSMGSTFAGGPFQLLTLDDSSRVARFERFVSPGATPVTVGAGGVLPIVRLTFHVRQSPAIVGSYVAGSFLRFRTPLVTFASVLIAGNVDVSGTRGADNINIFTSGVVTIVIEGTNKPNFVGLDLMTADPPGALSGSITPAPATHIGNTVSLSWLTNGAEANDRRASAETRYRDGRLRYRVRRSESGTFNLESSIDLTGLTIGDPFYRFQDGPGTGIPAGGANPLSDGTTYTYRINAIDDTRPFANELGDGIGDPDTPATRTITPYDVTPPADVGGLSRTVGNQFITLSWTNPSDADFQGAVIVRRDDGNPISGTTFEDGATRLARASGIGPNGPTIPLVGSAFGGGTVVAVISDGSTSFIDGPPGGRPALNNGQNYNYRLITYDIATADGIVPRQQGRNYSSGVAIAGTPGVPPNSITSFQAISGPAGQIRLRWRNPTGSVPFGGTLILANTNDDPLSPSAYWDPLPSVGAGGVLAITPAQQDFIFYNRPATGDPGAVDFIDIGVPDISATYFFRAYTYNSVPGGLGATGVLWGAPHAADRAAIQGNVPNLRFGSPTEQEAAMAGVAGGAGQLVYNLSILLPDRVTAPDNIRLLWQATSGVTQFDIYASTDLQTWTKIWEGSTPGAVPGVSPVIPSIAVSDIPGFNFATPPFSVDTPAASPIMYFRVLPEAEPDTPPPPTTPREVVGKYTVRYARPGSAAASKPNIFTFSPSFMVDANPTTPTYEPLMASSIMAQIDAENPDVGENRIPLNGRVDYVGFWNHDTLASSAYIDPDVAVAGIPNPDFALVSHRAYQVGLRSGGAVRWTMVGRLVP